MLTWNVGSLHERSAELTALMLQEAPHIVLLQEARLPQHLRGPFDANMRNIGYMTAHDNERGLVTVWRRGLNAALLKRTCLPNDEQDPAWRYRDVALQLKSGSRLCIRNVHAPTGSSAGAARADLLRHCSETLPGDLHMVVGDFNQRIVNDHSLYALTPGLPTFRKSADSSWITSIDGALASPLLARDALTTLPRYHGQAQHHPVRIVLATEPLTHGFLRWHRKDKERYRWTPSLCAEFQMALACDIDRAWAIWHHGAGGASDHSDLRKGSPWGSWGGSDTDAAVQTLWKKYRRLSAKGTWEADREAHAALDGIAVLLEESAATRLGKWRDKVGTRTGAASWIKHKMTQESPGVEGFTNAPLSHHDSAEDMAYQLASRWNVAVHTVADDYRGSLSGLTGDGPPTTCQQQYPERRHAGPLDLYFNDIPPLPDLPAWTWNAVLTALSSGAPGLDGWSAKTIKDTDIISQNYLLLLLEEADKGRWPRFWNDARVVAIPKPGSTERRPLTVLSVFYRVWARRAALHLGQWADGWMPTGLHGGRPGVSAADAVWKVSMDFNDAKTSSRTRCYLALDQEKFFDRLLLPALHDMAGQLSLPPVITQALSHYARLKRYVFIDGYPTRFVLHGPDPCGLPQGCPLAPFFANLTAAAWEFLVKDCCGEDVLPYTFLDDRMIISSDPSLLEKALAETKDFDTAVGTSVNTNKSSWIAFGGFRPGPLLKTYSRTRALVYLGTDFSATRRQPRAKQRAANALERARFAACLPVKTRPAAVADIVASLWLAGTSCYGDGDSDKLVSSTASALRGRRRNGQVQNRSRLAEHLMYAPGLHQSHPVFAAIYTFAKSLARFLAKPGNAPIWDAYWRSLRHAHGPLAAVCKPLARYGFAWSNATTLQREGFTIDLAEPPVASKPELARYWHGLRSALRTAAWHSEALRRPKDFQGASSGIRRTKVDLMAQSTGPSLATAGSWTSARLYIAGLSAHPRCVRCDSEWETKEHRLWDCPANLADRRRLWSCITLDTRLVLHHGLPTCLRRCGLWPNNFNAPRKDVEAIQQYLLTVNASATHALATAKGELPEEVG